MEISVVLGEDCTKVKFQENTKKMELTRNQLEMGIRFLNAAEGVSSSVVPNSTPTPQEQKIITEPSPVASTRPAVEHPVAPQQVTSANNTKMVKKKPAPNVKKAKMFLTEIEKQNKILKEEGNQKAVNTEMAFRRAIISTKDKIDMASMQAALRKEFGVPEGRFEIIYSQAGQLNDQA